MILNHNMKIKDEKVSIPPALLVVIEDAGWWSGFDRFCNNEPYRTGMNRMHCPEDYLAIVRLASLLKTQILAGFVLCEWDRNGLLRELPSATWMGKQWIGPMKGSPLLNKAAKILNDNLNYIKIGMHGIGHEYWENGVVSRTEFHNKSGEMRSREEVIKHIEMFHKLLEASGINARFPEIYIPPALRHSFGNGRHGFQQILSDYGISYVITVFAKARQYSEPLYPEITQECGVTVIERGVSPVCWNDISASPQFSFKQTIIPLHWANILSQNTEYNGDVVDRWADFLLKGVKENGFILLPKVSSTISQIIFHKLARIEPFKEGVCIDISAVRRVFPEGIKKGCYLKLPVESRNITVTGAQVKPAVVNNIKGIVKLIPSDSDIVRITF